KVLPDAKVAWSNVWIGAALTALLFTVGKLAIGLYLGKSDVGSAYGAAGSLVIVLVWVYYSAQILLFGAEFTQVYANTVGARIIPAEHAEMVNPEKADDHQSLESQTCNRNGGQHAYSRAWAVKKSTRSSTRSVSSHEEVPWWFGLAVLACYLIRAS